jgi:phosphoribosylaminoimidazole carboxylase PurE protein
MGEPSVGIIMGSQSDWPTLREAAAILDELGVAYEARIVSAHRTPDRLWDYGKTAVDRGLKVIIAGAGGAAHLPGMMASKTRVPVIGVPVQTKALSGVDSLYSIVQMPRGYPCGDHGHRRGGRGQCRADGRRDPRHVRPGTGRAAGRLARRCRPPSPRRPR